MKTPGDRTARSAGLRGALSRPLRSVVPLAKLGVRRVLGRKSPFSISLSVTNRCNFHCQYCDLPTQERPEMTATQWCRAIDEFAAGGMGRSSLIGGEPLLREDLGEIIQHLRRRGIHAAMNTNGWYLEERLAELKQLDLVCVTLDGPRELHDAQRRRGSYDRVLRGIEALRGAGVRVVTMTVLTRVAPEAHRHVAEVARTLGTQAFYQVEHDASADVFAPVGAHLTDRDLDRIVRNLLALKAEGLPVGNSRVLLQRHLREGRRLGITCDQCYAGSYFGYVLPDGTVAPCLLTQWTVEQENGRKRGFLRAFQELAPPRGPGCGCMPTHEVNAALSFDPGAFLGAVDLAWGSPIRGQQSR